MVLSPLRFTFAAFPFLLADPASATKYSIMAQPTHGINTFNNEKTADFSGLATWPPMLNADVMEIGFYNPATGAPTANIITKDTPASTLIGTTSDFIDKMGDPTITYDETLFNRPLNEIGTSYFFAENIADRVDQTPYEDISGPQVIHRAKYGDITGLTVQDWSGVCGKMEYECTSFDSETDFELKVAGLVPKGVYTMWNVGANKPGAPDEELAVVPFAGLPNIVIADENGCLRRTGTMSVCPSRPCSGSAHCTWYLSLFYHWDNMAFGGSPTPHFFNSAPQENAPVGVFAGNQVFFALAEEIVNPTDPASPSRMLQSHPEVDFSACNFDDSNPNTSSAAVLPVAGVLFLASFFAWIL